MSAMTSTRLGSQDNLDPCGRTLTLHSPCTVLPTPANSHPSYFPYNDGKLARVPRTRIGPSARITAPLPDPQLLEEQKTARTTLALPGTIYSYEESL